MAETPDNAEFAALVAHAMVIVSRQADCTVDEALEMMNDRAHVAHLTLTGVVLAVVNGDIRFSE